MREKTSRAVRRIGADGIIDELKSLTGSRRLYEVWQDWVRCMALAISNAVDRSAPWEAREREFEQVIKRYPEGAKDTFARALAQLTVELEQDPRDVLGSLLMVLEFGSDHAGQFFTPWDVCVMMAKMTLEPEAVHRTIAEHGFITVSEPAVGGGGMVLAAALELRALGYEPARHMHVTAVDVDRGVLMLAYVQASLLGVPGVFVHGNSLSLEEHEHFYTPMHVHGGWSRRLRVRRRLERERAAAMDTIDCPLYQLGLEV
jgi:hypothetical protein